MQYSGKMRSVFISGMRWTSMAKRNPWAAVIGTTVLAGGALLGRKLKNKDKNKDKKNETAPVADTEVIADATVQTPETYAERRCPSCGNIDTSGASNCPLCFANMDPNAEFVEDF